MIPFMGVKFQVPGLVLIVFGVLKFQTLGGI